MRIRRNGKYVRTHVNFTCFTDELLERCFYFISTIPTFVKQNMFHVKRLQVCGISISRILNFVIVSLYFVVLECF